MAQQSRMAVIVAGGGRQTAGGSTCCCCWGLSLNRGSTLGVFLSKQQLLISDNSVEILPPAIPSFPVRLWPRRKAVELCFPFHSVSFNHNARNL